jgi:transposase
MGNPAGIPRDFVALEQRRMKAARLLQQGMSNSEVARRLGVHRQSVIRWARELARSGVAGLKMAGRAGRKPRLGSGQLRAIEQELKRGPQALGYATGAWTAGRVRELIERETGVRYHEVHVWRIMRRLGWSGQAPHGMRPWLIGIFFWCGRGWRRGNQPGNPLTIDMWEKIWDRRASPEFAW